MRKITVLLVLITLVSFSFAQNRPSNTQLVKHDTMLLRADQCEWIIKSLGTTTAANKSEIGKSVSQIILEAIEKGTIKAVDVESNQPIPAKEIFTWRIETETMETVDDAGNAKYSIVQPLRTPDNVSRIKVYQDVYFNFSTKKFQSIIKWIELTEEVRSRSGEFIGYIPFCRIYY